MFAFKYNKALQAAAYLLRREPTKQMNYMRLLKLLYIADRESIRRSGHPITGDRVAALERGPILSKVLDLIKGADLQSPDWSSFIQRNEYDVRIVNDPGVARLTRSDIDLLEQAAEEHRADDEWAMVEFTHTFPEWQKNDPGKSMKWIPFHDILEAVGRQDDEADIQDDARTDCAFTQLFGG